VMGGPNIQQNIPYYSTHSQANQVTKQVELGNGTTGYQYGTGTSGTSPWGPLPWVWARPDSAFAFRILWHGSAFDLPVGGTVTYTMTNPHGTSRTWVAHFVSSADHPTSQFIQGSTPPYDAQDLAVINVHTLQKNGNDASEYVSAFTDILRHTLTTGGAPHMTAWSLSGSLATAQADGAHIAVTVSLTLQDGQVVTWTQPDMVTVFNFPTWYLAQVVSNNLLQAAQKKLQENGGVPTLGNSLSGGSFN